MIRKDSAKRNEIPSTKHEMKSQAPSTKHQRSTKFQAPNTTSSNGGFSAWSLKFLWSLRLGGWSFVPRGLALFLGGFCLLNLLGQFRFARFDANLWWIDLHWFPQSAANVFLLICSVVLIAFGLRVPASGWRRWLTMGCAAALLIGAFADTIQFFVLLVNGAVRSGLPIPLSLFVSAALGLILAATVKRTVSGRALPAFAVCLGCIAVFPLAQMFCFGKTDYRRPADAIVVLGARAYADGRPRKPWQTVCARLAAFITTGWLGR